MNYGSVSQLENCGRIFGSICFNGVTFIDQYLVTLSKYFSRFQLGVHKVTLHECYTYKANLSLLLSYIQKSVEILFVNCHICKQEEEMVETLPALKFKRLKKLTIGKIKSEVNEEFYTSAFQRAPVLENLRIYSNALGVINGKPKLQKLTLRHLECK
jgi:hypothetical protein